MKIDMDKLPWKWGWVTSCEFNSCLDMGFAGEFIRLGKTHTLGKRKQFSKTRLGF